MSPYRFTTSVGPSFSADNIESDAGFIAVGELGQIKEGEEEAADAAAIRMVMVAGAMYYGLAQLRNDEYGGEIYRTQAGDYGFTLSDDSGKHADYIDLTGPPFIPDGATLLAMWHVHIYLPNHSNENFSPADLYSDQKIFQVPGFLITPSGSLKEDLFMNYSWDHPYWPNEIITVCQKCFH